MPTLEDVARKAGVSPSTVSRILSGRGNAAKRYSDVTKAKVMQVSEELGYKPNLAARALASGRTHIIAVIFPRVFESPFTALFTLQILTGIEATCNRHGYHPLVASPYVKNGEIDPNFSGLLQSGYLDGVIIGGDFTFPPLVDIVAEHGIPQVVLGHQPHEPSLRSDNYDGGYQVMQYVLQQGHRQIGIIGVPDHIHLAADQRLAGMRQAALNFGVNFDALTRADGNFSKDSGAEATVQLLQRSPGLSAIIALNDRMAMGAIRQCQSHGYHVPDDISVIGYDDLPQSAEFTPALTTVSQSVKQWGQLAVDMLLQLIQGEMPESIVLPAQLIIRDSSAAYQPRKG